MANDDVFKALQMFQSGVQQFALQRAIGSANEQVQQLRASDLNEQEKRSQLQQLSNQLVAQMAGIGAPATTIEQVAGAIGPKKFANANQMKAESLLTGDNWLGEQADEQQEFENNKAFELAKIRANAANNPIAQIKVEQAKEQFLASTYKQINTRISEATATGQSGLGKVSTMIRRMDDAEALTSKDPSKVTNIQVRELATMMDSMFRQGQATVSGTHELVPETLNQKIAKLKEMASSSPQPSNIPGFVELYKDTIGRVRQITQVQRDAMIKEHLKGNGTIAAMNPDAFKSFAESKLPEDPVVSIDTKTKRITFQSDVEEAELKEALKHAAKGGADAQAVFQAAQGHPRFFLVAGRNASLIRKIKARFAKGE
jgi:hypothetical protein